MRLRGRRLAGTRPGRFFSAFSYLAPCAGAFLPPGPRGWLGTAAWAGIGAGAGVFSAPEWGILLDHCLVFIASWFVRKHIDVFEDIAPEQSMSLFLWALKTGRKTCERSS